jgi:hypothetical protein
VKGLAAASISVLLALAAMSQPASAQGQSATPMTPCQCLQCFPAAIRYSDAMADGFVRIAQAEIPQYWDNDPDVQAAHPDRAQYLEDAYRDSYEVIRDEASESAPSPPQCWETGAGPLMTTRLSGDCGISLREEARMRLPCEDIYLSAVSHELVHRQYCSDHMAVPPPDDAIAERALSHADAYRTQADVLRILYLRRSRECQSPTTYIRFNDLPQAVDYLNRALNYEREFPLGSFPEASFRPGP